MAATLKLDLIVDDKGMVKINKFTSKTSKEVTKLGNIVNNKLSGAMKKFKSVSMSAFSGISKAVFSLGGMFAALGAGMVVKNIIDTAAGFERMQISLDTITKGEGAEWFQKLNEWALKMPINTEKAIQAFTMMRAMGLQPTIEQMTTLVDATSALGGDADMLQGIARALGQIATKGKVTAEELMQLAERGVPVFEILKEKMQLTGAQLGNIGKQGLDAGETIQKIFEGLADRFGGQSKKMQDTWTGMVETLKSYWKEFARLMMESGAFEYLKDKLRSIIDTIDQMAADGRLQEWAEEAGHTIVKVFTDIRVTIEMLWPVIEYIAKGFKWLGEFIGNAIGRLEKFNNLIGKINPANLVMEFLGKGSPVRPLTEKIDEMENKMVGLSNNISGMNPAFTINVAPAMNALQNLQNQASNILTSMNQQTAMYAAQLYEAGDKFRATQALKHGAAEVKKQSIIYQRAQSYLSRPSSGSPRVTNINISPTMMTGDRDAAREVGREVNRVMNDYKARTGSVGMD